ncbi:uncharacterized protein LOC115964824 [Quercus lobata]|uniref:uncharacterized protein LOC115964824 n=1 Tax=Quercus lobata TaxID=97700 RepID=UPI0012454C0A|nr:uncharacterized protein LOC115964824 [Quercus lobata]
MVPRQGKQQKTTRGQKNKRASSMESRDEENRAEVGAQPRTWGPKLELDGVAIPYTASVREYNRGRAGYIAEALEQPVLLPRDMEAYKRFSQPELFLSLKRDLAMITQQVFVAEEFCRSNRSLAEAEAQSQTEVEKTMGSLKQENFELAEKFKEAEKKRRSAEAVVDLRATLQKAEEEVQRDKEEVQLAREVAEAEKKAAYQLRVGETEAKLSEEIPEMCRDYCSISWAHALDAAGIPADSALRLPGNVFFPPEIRENPDGAPKVSEQAVAIPDAIPLLDKAKDPAKESISEVPPPQPEQKENPPTDA